MSKFQSSLGELDQLELKLENNVNPESTSASSTPILTIKESKPKLKTFEGVYIPVISSIWGIIFFLRILQKDIFLYQLKTGEFIVRVN